MHDYRPGDETARRTVLRREDMRFVTGRGRYTDDIHVDGEAYAVFVRSDHAHGELVAVRTAAELPTAISLPWRFSDAGPPRVSIDPRLPASENLHTTGHAVGGRNPVRWGHYGR